MPSLCSTAQQEEQSAVRDLLIESIRSVIGALVLGLGLKCLTSKAFCVGNATAVLMRTLGPAALIPKARQLRARETYIET